MHFDTLGTRLWMDPIQRIYCLYFGSVLVLAGLLLLYIFCPIQVRKSVDSSGYADSVFKSLDARELEIAHSRIRPLFQTEKPEELHPFLGYIDAKHVSDGLTVIKDDPHRRSTLQMPDRQNYAGAVLKAHFLLLDRTRPLPAGLSLVLFISGGLVFLLPSVEVFLMVVGRIFKAASG